MTLKIQAGSRLVMIGDSITDCDRLRPVGEGRESNLGTGYVGFVDGLLRAIHPQHPIRITNMGISGNTVRDLDTRWQRDVLALKPDWLSIKIGINDVWRNFGTWAVRRDHVPLPEYRETLEKLVAATRPRLAGLVLMSPYYIEPDRTDPMRAMMDEYGQAVCRLAEKYDAHFVDTQAAFDRALQHLEAGVLAEDRVHPGRTGHLLIARAFLAAIGLELAGTD